LNFLDRFSKKISNIKFRENPSSASRIVPKGRTDVRIDRQTDMTKLIVTVTNFANPTKNWKVSGRSLPLPDLRYSNSLA